MEIREAYNVWAGQYDTDSNKTRDFEALSLRNTLANINFTSCLEIGCGTGKNTEWLITRAEQITAVDFSEEMLAKATCKIQSDKVQFCLSDITKDWDFVKKQYDLITFSLVLNTLKTLMIYSKKFPIQ